MITKDYKPSMVPKICSNDRYKKIDGKLTLVEKFPPTIQVSKEYFVSIQPFSDEDKKILQDSLCGTAICPALYWFKDSPDIRRILHVS